MSEITKLLENKNIKQELFKLVNKCSIRAKQKLKENEIKEKKVGSIVQYEVNYIVWMIYKEL